ncbi:MAG TPA: type II toxin-antitoxin system VapC family toxin [Gemmataceae bacterium]|nr:type II toxin-antitoxin system VapC family toxin [Gemmataceae bacterium]
MNSFYLDASALAKRYAPEPGSLLVDHLLTSVSPNRLYVFNVGMAEVISILVRKRNTGALSAAALNQAWVVFDAEIATSAVHRTAADDTLVRRSVRLIDTHSINGTDAIILRSALDTATDLRATKDDLVLVASDLRLLRAAQAERLKTFNPETDSLADLNSLL